MVAVLLSLALLQSPQSPDADTRAWWGTTTQLSSDSMEGRDTGSPGYERAAGVVARRIAGAGLKPLGDNGTWFQSVPMDEVAVTGATIEVGGETLNFLHDIIVSA